jgi:hypothetical protein
LFFKGLALCTFRFPLPSFLFPLCFGFFSPRRAWEKAGDEGKHTAPAQRQTPQKCTSAALKSGLGLFVLVFCLGFLSSFITQLSGFFLCWL